ncbi:hypothetical protein [Clostridium akagii]|nr:hypothetical protein [Clostridium akagii]
MLEKSKEVASKSRIFVMASVIPVDSVREALMPRYPNGKIIN